MTAASRDLIAAFDALPSEEQHAVAAMILQRAAPSEELPDVALDELGAELFRTYDAEEAARAER
jgi:hypothetical protein